MPDVIDKLEKKNETLEWGSVEWFQSKLKTQGFEDPGAYFAHQSNGYQRFRHRRLLARLEHSLSVDQTQGAILDIGCGLGDLTHRLKKDLGFYSARGTDFVESAVLEAKKRYPEIDFKVGELPKLDYLDKEFQAVLASEVLYYLSSDDRKRAIAEIYRVLDDNGVLFFSSVLGDDYFSEESAKALVAEKFDVEDMWIDHYGLYHRFIHPITLLTSFYYVMYMGTKGTSQKVVVLKEKYGEFLNFVPVKLFFLLLFKCSAPVLTWQWLPKVLSGIGRIFMPDYTKSNIALVVTKRSDLPQAESL